MAAKCYEEGLAIRREVLGAARGDGMIAADGFNKAIQDMVTARTRAGTALFARTGGE